MHTEYLLLLLVPMGALSQRILGCRMPNGSLNPSPNICNQAGGSFRSKSRGCCTRNTRDGPVVTESRFISGCNDNGGFVGSNEILATSC
uniref:Secreted in xylem 14 n=2 Tax=Fusarium oxysporum TaxID=5507 RepID=A0A7G5WH88_FUSOX|nr:secreted in xylem 14 [Fusarium oxysporum]QNA42595.1 secreted in xylem 14 [Fusarium oxysporum f. sp. pisi]QMX85500.1 secreted in xylem 14 [Fusarium oxysporum]QMX85501.1 secreted in xylem 14 [Fusarium oxysporum]QMX85502.1 secreted in xylem 14 [Fusarium oxysporum]